MNDLLIWSLKNARKQTLSLIEDLSDEQMRLQSATGENPPIWILGHLLLGDTYLLHLLNVSELNADFTELLSKYGPQSTNRNFDSKQFLVKRLTETNLLRCEAVRRMNDLNKPMPDETLAKTQATIAHHLQMLVFHEGNHCGQLSSWRKLQGLSAVKGIFAS
ncbi:MAG TPA: DinB family protein [Pyrinomonadaceae bacterium]|nr:DinB family protein [Pyrinomonadaceae bacterium]